MKDNKVIAAIDMGSAKVTTIIAQVNLNESSLEKNVNIVGVASVDSKGVRKGQIVDIEEAVETVVSSVEAAERMAGYNLSRAYISVGGAHINSLNSHGVVAISNPDSEISQEDIERVIDAAKAVSLPSSREVIHVIPREYTVDGEGGVKDPVGMTGVRLEVETHLVSASSPAIKNIVKTVSEVGVEVEELVFSGLAAAEAVLTNTEKELGCVLVDIGGGTTSVAVFIEGSLAYSSEIPIGAKNVTNDLAIGLRVSIESAEKIKLALSKKEKLSKTEKEVDYIDIATFGADESKKVSKKTLVEGIIRPRLNEIFTMVKLDLAKAEIINKIPSGVVITGGGALTVGVVDSSKRMMALPARIGEPKGVGGLIDDILNPAYSAPIGLILWGSKNIEASGVGSIGKRIKLPTKGIIGKFVQTIRDLLP